MGKSPAARPSRTRTTQLVKARDVLASLAISGVTFWRKWHAVFTDPRPPADRRKGVERKVYRDELDVAVNDAASGAAAVLNFRRLVGRL